MERQSLTFEFEWDAGEYRRLHRSLLLHGSQRWMVLGGLAISAVLVVLFVAASAFGLLMGEPPSTSSFILLLFPAFWIFFLFWSGPRTAARAYAKLHGGPHRMELDTNAVRATTAAGMNELKWAAFSRAVETPEFFLLFFAGSAAYYLPKRAIRSQGNLEAVRSLLRERFGSKAALRSEPGAGRLD